MDKFKEIRPIALGIYHIKDDNCETDAYWIDIDEFKNNNKILYTKRIFKYL